MEAESGFIEVIYGPMFSGKSTELLRNVRRFGYSKKKCLVINYAFDNRYSQEEVMSTHDK
jgi:thymidine kinase